MNMDFDLRLRCTNKSRARSSSGTRWRLISLKRWSPGAAEAFAARSRRCCVSTLYSDSLLGAAAQAAGWSVRRWGPPGVDLPTTAGADQVFRSVAEDLRRGKVVLVWASLPCGPRSPLHRLINPAWSYQQLAKYQGRRKHDRPISLTCLHLLANVCCFRDAEVVEWLEVLAAQACAPPAFDFGV
jgi:hypothetical protein